MMISDPDQIARFRLLTLRQMLKLESLGMKSRGKSALSILRAEGLVKSRTAKKALEEINAILDNGN